MYDVAPGVLQRLREADIISRAGLAIASQGQEYCRAGAVHSTRRQGARLSGIVDLSHLAFNGGVTATNAAKAIENYPLDRYSSSVELRDSQTWNVHCTCPMMTNAPTSMCPHAAALLYQWLAHPFTFASPVDAISSAPAPESAFEASTFADMSYKAPSLVNPLHTHTALRMPGSSPALNTADTLSQLALGDLRSIAREYDIAGNGSGKAELVDAILDKLRQPEAVRRVVGTLEKAQRQFLATLTLAGGQMSDEELRGLFERFSLGKPEKLQQMLLTLQGKVLLLRANMNMSFQLRSSLNSSLLDVNWFVPLEVRAALHIALPTTTFNIDGQDAPATIVYAEPFHLLPDLLLVARALDGYRMERDERGGKRNTGNLARAVNAQPNDSSTALPAPSGLPPASLLEYVQALVPRPLPLLRFAFLVLRLSDILYIENETNHAGTSLLRMLPNAAELLLGTSHSEVLSELFTHWQQQSTYREIFDLQEEGLSLRCRATPMNQPALRTGELEAENKAARQTLLTLLAQAPTQQWIDFTAFARLIYRLNPTFLQRRQRAFPTPHWWIEQEEGRPLQSAQWNDWQRAEGRYLAQLLQGPLRWWGISDLAFKEDGRLQAFRLTPMIELLLKGEPAGTQSIAPLNTDLANDTSIIIANSNAALTSGVHAHIDVSEQDELLLLSSFENWPAIQLVERFAQARGVRNGRLCYRLTPASLGEALNRGESFTPLLNLLRRASESEREAGEVEEHEQGILARLLSQLEKRLANYGRARLYTDATLLEVADGLVMRELHLTTSVEKHILKHIHPTLMILKKQGGEQLVEELKKRGSAPLLHEEG